MDTQGFSEMVSNIFNLLLAVCIGVGGIAWVISSYRQPRIAISKWATTHQYTLVRCRYSTFRRGPFFRFWRHNQVPVFQIVVTDPNGQIRAGWAKYEWSIPGPIDMKVEVRWDALETNKFMKKLKH